MPLSREPLFLARQNYRRRRVTDAARGLPVVGVILFMVPLLSADQGRNDTGGWLVYLFLAWFVLILVAAGLSAGVGRADDPAADGEEAAQSGASAAGRD